jgi:hypothetical protein
MGPWKWIYMSLVCIHIISCTDLESAECRAFRRLTDPVYDTFSRNQSLILVKVPKCASSTIQGTIRRTARNHGLHGVHMRQHEAEASSGGRAFVFADHTFYSRLGRYRERADAGSQIWMASVRNPEERILSQFYHFRMTRRRVRPTIQNKISFFRGNEGALMLWMGDPAYPHLLPNDKYAFIFIQERLLESMLAYLFTFHLSLNDILFLTSKNSTEGRADDITKRVMAPNWGVAREPQEIQDYLRSAGFRERNKMDYKIVEAANKRLDTLIAQVDPDLWIQSMVVYKRVQQMVYLKCAPPPGQGLFKYDCLFWDGGCGTGCIDALYKEMTEGGCAKWMGNLGREH